MELTVVSNQIKNLCLATGVAFEANRMPFFEKELSKFPESVLEQACSEVARKWDKRSFPPISVILQECRDQSVLSRKTTIVGGDFVERIESAMERARQKAKQFTVQFEFSNIGKGAKEEGWWSFLEQYVYQCSEYHFLFLEKKQGNIFNVSSSIYQAIAPSVKNCLEIEQTSRERQGMGAEPTIEVDARLLDFWRSVTSPLQYGQTA